MTSQVDPTLRIAAVTPHGAAEALALLWPELSPASRQRQLQMLTTANANRQAAEPGMPALWGAFRRQQLVAALRVDVRPGRTAVVAPPRLVPGEGPHAARELLAAVLRALRAANVQVVQALLTGSEGSDADLLVAGGMRHVADLLYLVSLSGEFPTTQPQADFELTAYDATQHARLTQTIEQTYAGSLDCPATEGMRATGDVLAGYQASGASGSEFWRIASRAGHDIGCLLLADDPLHDQSEITYLGVVPQARGSGVGLALVRQAQWLARKARRARLVLAVDAANHPALAVYEAAGFITCDRRSVFLRAL